jgi:hypothetical protein
VRIRRIVQPLSSMFTLRPSDSQQAQEPWVEVCVPCILMSSAYRIHDVFELHDGHANECVVPTEAVVLHSNVELVGQHLLLVSNDAGSWDRLENNHAKNYLQMECFVEFW